MLEDAKRGMEIGEKVMIELFTTPKEQVKIELFQYILFSRAGEFSKDLKEKLNLKNETFRRYSKELAEDIHELFGQDIKIINILRLVGKQDSTEFCLPTFSVC